jgi:hypothetical protein
MFKERIMQTRRTLVPFVIAVALGISRQAHAAWQPPIGIPAPPFGIHEVAPPRPNPWTAPVPGYYYVDEASGTDANNGYGTPARPRKTIPDNLPAGSVVEVHGVYTRRQTSPLGITALGTADKPVFLRGVSSKDRPVFTERMAVDGSYFILENLEFALSVPGKGAFQIVPDQQKDNHHIVLRYSEVHGNLQGGGVQIFTPTAQGAHSNSHLVLYRNAIHHNGDVQATTDQDIHGINIVRYGNNIWILENELSYNSGDGLQINAGADGLNGTLHHIYGGRNVAHHNKQTGLWVKQASDVVLSQNTSHHHVKSNSSGGSCMGTQYSPERLWYLFNYVYECEIGFRASTDIVTTRVVTDHYYIGNLIHDIHRVIGTYRPNNSWDEAAFSIVGDGPVTRHLINNTAYNIDAGVNVPQRATKLVMRNNIFGGLAPNRGTHINLSREVAANSTLDYTLFDPAAQIIWGDGKIHDLKGFRTLYPQQGGNSLESGATFVDPTTRDYHVQSSSPAVDHGTDDGAYHTFFALYGIDIAKDINGGQRPQNQWDLGASELGPSVAPPAPFILRVN